MDNEITINVAELLKVDDNSITDFETIRQIGLLSCTVNNVSQSDRYILYRKVKQELQYAGLYPTIMKTFDVMPEKLNEDVYKFIIDKRVKSK